MIGTDRNNAELNGNKEQVTDIVKPVTQAVNEITSGVVGYVRSEAIEKAREYEQEKIDAISQLETEQTAEEE